MSTAKLYIKSVFLVVIIGLFSHHGWTNVFIASADLPIIAKDKEEASLVGLSRESKIMPLLLAKRHQEIAESLLAWGALIMKIDPDARYTSYVHRRSSPYNFLFLNEYFEPFIGKTIYKFTDADYELVKKKILKFSTSRKNPYKSQVTWHDDALLSFFDPVHREQNKLRITQLQAARNSNAVRIESYKSNEIVTVATIDKQLGILANLDCYLPQEKQAYKDILSEARKRAHARAFDRQLEILASVDNYVRGDQQPAERLFPNDAYVIFDRDKENYPRKLYTASHKWQALFKQYHIYAGREELTFKEYSFLAMIIFESHAKHLGIQRNEISKAIIEGRYVPYFQDLYLVLLAFGMPNPHDTHDMELHAGNVSVYQDIMWTERYGGLCDIGTVQTYARDQWRSLTGKDIASRIFLKTAFVYSEYKWMDKIGKDYDNVYTHDYIRKYIQVENSALLNSFDNQIELECTRSVPRLFSKSSKVRAYDFTQDYQELRSSYLKWLFREDIARWDEREKKLKADYNLINRAAIMVRNEYDSLAESYMTMVRHLKTGTPPTLDQLTRALKTYAQLVNGFRKNEYNVLEARSHWEQLEQILDGYRLVDGTYKIPDRLDFKEHGLWESEFIQTSSGLYCRFAYDKVSDSAGSYLYRAHLIVYDSLKVSNITLDDQRSYYFGDTKYKSSDFSRALKYYYAHSSPTIIENVINRNIYYINDDTTNLVHMVTGTNLGGFADRVTSIWASSWNTHNIGSDVHSIDGKDYLISDHLWVENISNQKLILYDQDGGLQRTIDPGEEVKVSMRDNKELYVGLETYSVHYAQVRVWGIPRHLRE